MKQSNSGVDRARPYCDRVCELVHSTNKDRAPQQPPAGARLRRRGTLQTRREPLEETAVEGA